VFSWAMIFAPAACSHSLPSAWSKCQCVLQMRDGVSAEIRQRFYHLSLRHPDAGVDQYFAIGTREHADTAA
jgi:hypothetical protein